MSQHQNTSRAYMRARYRADIERGICPNCRARPPREGRTTCEACAARNSRINRARRRKLVPLFRDLKICIHCGCRAAMTQRRWCAVCSEAHTEKMRQQAYRRIAAGLCRKCGAPMDREGTTCVACCETRARKTRERYARKKRREAA